jgi:DNA-binding NarL/FixJ family response regulator
MIGVDLVESRQLQRKAISRIRLTHREVEILTLTAKGLRSQMIADQLYLSKRTVDFHLNNTFKKLGANNRLLAVLVAWKYGLLPFEPNRSITQPYSEC